MSFQSCINESYNAIFNNLTVNGQLALTSGSITDLTVSDALTCSKITSSTTNLNIVPNTVMSGSLQVFNGTNLSSANISENLIVGQNIQANELSAQTCNISNTLTSNIINNSASISTDTLTCTQLFDNKNIPIFPIYAYASNYNGNIQVNCSVNFTTGSTSSSYNVTCTGCVGILICSASSYTNYVYLTSVENNVFNWTIYCQGGGSSPQSQNAAVNIMII